MTIQLIILTSFAIRLVHNLVLVPLCHVQLTTTNNLALSLTVFTSSTTSHQHCHPNTSLDGSSPSSPPCSCSNPCSKLDAQTYAPLLKMCCRKKRMKVLYFCWTTCLRMTCITYRRWNLFTLDTHYAGCARMVNSKTLVPSLRRWFCSQGQHIQDVYGGIAGKSTGKYETYSEVDVAGKRARHRLISSS